MLETAQPVNGKITNPTNVNHVTPLVKNVLVQTIMIVSNVLNQDTYTKDSVLKNALVMDFTTMLTKKLENVKNVTKAVNNAKMVMSMTVPNVTKENS